MENTTENTDDKKESKRPDFVKDESQTTNFGETGDKEIRQENHPSAGNQTQTGAATNNSELDVEPEDDGDGSIVGPND